MQSKPSLVTYSRRVARMRFPGFLPSDITLARKQGPMNLRQWTRCLIGVASPLLAVAFAAAPPAQAGCGDYVVYGQKSDLGANHSDGIASPVATGHENPATSGHHRPCQGPHCGRGNLPPLVPPAPVLGHGQRWAVTPVLIPVAAPAPANWLLEGNLCRPVQSVSAIFHPPRFS